MKTTLVLLLLIGGGIVLVWVYKPAKASLTPTLEYNSISHNPGQWYDTALLHLERPLDQHRYEDLQLYPIYASQIFLLHHQPLGPYTSLQDGLARKKIVITEITDKTSGRSNSSSSLEVDNAEVNRLFVENVSADTVIILGGEIIRGGKQDRMIAQDLMVMPHSGKVDINVFCVEHHRWTPDENTSYEFSQAMDVAPNKVRKAAYAKEGQGKVWEEVHELNESFDTNTSTGTLADAVNNEEMKVSVQAYKDRLGKINWSDNVVGIVAIRGNEVVGLDIFAQHSLFKNYYSSLLGSYCSDVQEVSVDESKRFEEVQALFSELLGSEESIERYLTEQGTQLKHGRNRIHLAGY